MIRDIRKNLEGKKIGKAIMEQLLMRNLASVSGSDSQLGRAIRSGDQRGALSNDGIKLRIAV